MPDVSIFNIQGTSINVKDTTARSTAESAAQQAGQALEKVTELENASRVNVSYDSGEETITTTTGEGTALVARNLAKTNETVQQQGQQITQQGQTITQQGQQISQQGQQIDAETEAREQADEQLRTEIAGRLSVAPKHYSDHYRLYVDGVNGNDDNDGSSSAPFKTLDRFLQTCNQDMTDIRCYIVSAGTYTATLQVLQGITLHITSTVPGVKIVWGSSDQEPFVWYNSHINFQGPAGSYIELDCPYPYVYGDNCLFTFVRVKWNCGFWTYSGAVDANNCTFHYCRFAKTNFDVYGGTTFTATADANAYKVYADQSTGRLTGTVTIPTDEPAEQVDKSCIITGQNSYFSVEFTPKTPANKYNNGIRLTNGVLFITNARLQAFSKASKNGNYINTTLIVNDNTTLPTSPTSPTSPKA